MKQILIFIGILISAGCMTKDHKNITQLPYPNTAKDSVVDDYFGTKVQDPYRWLENDTSKETSDWVTKQNIVTQDYLSQIPYRNKIKDRLTEIWNYAKVTAPIKKGDNYFYYKNDGLQNQ